MTKFSIIFDEVVTRLNHGLPDFLTYHNTAHTLHVLENSIVIAASENIDEHELLLIKIAALYHDIGFLVHRENHEEISCGIAEKDLLDHGFSMDDIRIIQGMIMATKIPQSPENLLENILADADLEYLGTGQYYEISGNLHKELLYFQPNMTDKDWLQIQIKFLESHHYHTQYCQQNREQKKQEHLAELIQQLKDM